MRTKNRRPSRRRSRRPSRRRSRSGRPTACSTAAMAAARRSGTRESRPAMRPSRAIGSRAACPTPTSRRRSAESRIDDQTQPIYPRVLKMYIVMISPRHLRRATTPANRRWGNGRERYLRPSVWRARKQTNRSADVMCVCVCFFADRSSRRSVTTRPPSSRSTPISRSTPCSCPTA